MRYSLLRILYASRRKDGRTEGRKRASFWYSPHARIYAHRHTQTDIPGCGVCFPLSLRRAPYIPCLSSALLFGLASLLESTSPSSRPNIDITAYMESPRAHRSLESRSQLLKYFAPGCPSNIMDFRCKLSLFFSLYIRISFWRTIFHCSRFNPHTL